MFYNRPVLCHRKQLKRSSVECIATSILTAIVLHLRNLASVAHVFFFVSEDTDANWYSIFPQFQYQTIYIMMIDKIVWLHSNPRMICFSFDLISWSIALRAMTIDKLFLSIHTDRFAYVGEIVNFRYARIRNAIKGNKSYGVTQAHQSLMLQNRKAYIELRTVLCMNISSDSRIPIALIPVHNRKWKQTFCRKDSAYTSCT
jgi:hypothetical protein